MTAEGKWQITIQTPVGDKSGVLDLAVDGTRLSGSLSDEEHHALITDGTVEGNTLTWSASITKPMRLNLKFSAVVDAGTIRGEAKYSFGRAPFSGTRV